MLTDAIPSSPLSIAWNFTYRCNMNCEHCYSRTEQGKELSREEQEQVLKKLIESRVIQISFGGGEPLLCPHFLPIAQSAKENGINVALSSNGWLIDDIVTQNLLSIKIDAVNISIDSANQEMHDKFRNCPGGFNKAIGAVSLLKKYGLKVKIVSVLSRINYQEVENLTRLAEDLKVDELMFRNYKPAGKGLVSVDRYDLTPIEWKETYRKLIELQKYSKVNINMGIGAEPILYLLTGFPADDGCQPLVHGSPCGKLSLCIKPNGDITPCAYMNLPLGNILKDGLLDVWQNSPVLYQLRHKEPKGKCVKCPSFKQCLGGCSSAAYNTSGCIDSPDPHCWWQPEMTEKEV